jgi:hypothetical protein
MTDSQRKAREIIYEHRLTAPNSYRPERDDPLLEKRIATALEAARAEALGQAEGIAEEFDVAEADFSPQRTRAMWVQWWRQRVPLSRVPAREENGR